MDEGSGPRRRSCLQMWTEENNKIVTRWEENKKNKERTVLSQCFIELSKLLQTIQGLPPAPASIPVEVAVFYNVTLFSLSTSDKMILDENKIKNVLQRVVEASGGYSRNSDILGLWCTALPVFYDNSCITSLHQLACLQWAVWLLDCQLEKILDYFRVLSKYEGWPSSTSERSSGDILKFMQKISFSADSNPLLLHVMSAGELKDQLYSCIVLAHGMEILASGKYLEAAQIFKEATSLSLSMKMQSKIFTLSGVCFQNLGKPQTALQSFRRALEADFSCLYALYQSSLVYRQLGMADAEFETLHLLCRAVSVPEKRDLIFDDLKLIYPDKLLRNPALIKMFKKPCITSVKYCLAQRSLESGRIDDAVEHYLDLLEVFQEEKNQEVFIDSIVSLPRIPEIYLEAAASLFKAKKFWDVTLVCEEVIKKIAGIVPEKLTIAVPLKDSEGCIPPNSESFFTQLESCYQKEEYSETVQEQKNEKLNCILWTAAAYFYQGWAFTELKDTKESITHLSRCINLLLTVHIVQSDGDCINNSETGKITREAVKLLHRLKGLAFVRRGISFMERGQEKEALLNFQLSQQSFPESVDGAFWLLEALWRLGRKDEAVSYWQKLQESRQSVVDINSIHRDAVLFLLPQQELSTSDLETLNKKIEEYRSQAKP
ncbi:Fanconi anemia group G protein isoform X1 [Polypterus senegalus]